MNLSEKAKKKCDDNLFINTTFESIFEGIKKRDQGMSDFCRV